MKKTIIALILGIMIGSAGTAFAALEGEVTAVFAQFKMMINGQEKQLETTPLVYNGTSYLPVREMANLVGYDVTYKADSRTIELNNGVQKDASNKSEVATQPQKGDGSMPVKTEIEGRELIELLARKYPKLIENSPSGISIHQDGTLKMGEDSYKLHSSKFGYYDITPLLDANILSQDDI